VDIITQEDIQESNAGKIVDVMRPAVGVAVRDYYGNGATSVVDIAGFGEQAALNVLVLVDGRRVNDADLSGVDWNQIPLDQVERIEIIRSGAASVLYGDNASSGVINIITKKGYSDTPKFTGQTEVGSYATFKQNLSLGWGAKDKFSYWLYGGHESTNGYRRNTFNKSDNFASKFEYSPTDILSTHLDYGYYASSYGMPSGLFQHHIDENGRQWARYGEDHADNRDYYVVSGNKAAFVNLGDLDIDFSYRHKNADSIFPTSHNDTRRNVIQTMGITPKYTLSSNILNFDNKFIAGLDSYRVFYTSNNYVSPNDTNLKNYTNIYKNSIGSYAQDEFSLSQKLNLVGGYRYEAARFAFNYHDFTGANPDRDAKMRPNMQAFNSGLVYNYKDDSSAFFNVGRSFRFPEVDEFTGTYDINFHQFLNTNLKPQSSLNYQAGLRHKFTDALNGSFSLFRMNVKDYIYFNPIGGVTGFGENENYDKTVHQGLESSAEAKLTDSVTLTGNYTFTDARFVGGIYGSNEIPMVARHKAGAGLRFALPKNITFNINDTYVGNRYVINDEANAVSRLNGYMVADTNIAWRCKDLQVSFGVNNLFNKKYSEYAVYGSDSSNGFVNDKCFFPSPTRNFNLKVDYAF
jgi:iron complex outermembrane receptor protein